MRPFLAKEYIGLQSVKSRLMKMLCVRFKSYGRVKEICKKSLALASDLAAECKGVESDFIRIGQELQAIYGDAKKLSRQVMDSVNVIGGIDGEGVLFQVRALAEESLAQLEGCQKDLSEKTTRINTVMEYLDSLSAEFPLIKAIGQRFRIVAMNISIESARLAESTDLFSVVVHETSAFSEKIMVLCEDSIEGLKSAQDKQRSLYSNMAGGLKEIDRLGGASRRIVQEAVREIEKLMAATIEAAEKVGEHSREISRQVGEIVVAIQFHDSMSQRVEHITKALDDVGQLLATDSPSEDGADYKRKLSYAHSIINLQTAHLKEIVVDIHRLYEKGIRSFEHILTETSELFNHLSHLSVNWDKSPDQERRTRDPFNRLKSSFSELNEVLNRGQALMEPARDASSRASETVDQVSGFVRRINTIGFEAHLIGLNAIVKAAHLGQERGALEVLAQEIKMASDQSTSVVERIDELLGSFTGVANGLRDSNVKDKAEVSFEGSTGEIALAYNRFMENFAAARGRADEINNAISRTKSRLDFLPKLAEELTGYLHQLEEMSRDLSPFSSGEHGLGKEEADKILDRYTMEKERKVHNTSFHGVSEQLGEGVIPITFPNDGAAITKEAGTENDLLDNVELFTDGAARETNNPGTMAELFDPLEPEEEREDPVKGSEPNDLGDNVELF
jgi:methyl-accepting chemotaxis protein